MRAKVLRERTQGEQSEGVQRGGRVGGRELLDRARALAWGAPVGRCAGNKGPWGLNELELGLGGTHLSGVGAPPAEALAVAVGEAPNGVG